MLSGLWGSDLGQKYPKYLMLVNRSLTTIHCKDTVPKIWNKYSQKWNCVASLEIPTFMYLRAINIYPRSVHLFCCNRWTDHGNIHINLSHLHECGNWERGHAVSFLGIHKSDLLCSVYAKTAKCENTRDNIQGPCTSNKDRYRLQMARNIQLVSL